MSPALEPEAEAFDVVQLSDLHLTKELHFGRRVWMNAVDRVRRGWPPPHDPRKIEALIDAFSDVTDDQRKPLDAVLVTGDLSTDGSARALRTAREIIEGNVYEGPVRRLRIDGLRVPASRRVVIPGNHDRYRSQYDIRQDYNNDRLEREFGFPPSYPYVVGHRRPGTEGNRDALTLAFFVFDSTPSPTGVKQGRFRSLFKRGGLPTIAGGKIERAECRRLVEMSRDLNVPATVTGLDGQPLQTQPASVVRIALLHHHPVLSRLPNHRGGDWVERRRRTLSELVDSHHFVRACLEAKIDVVLFGHEHLGYRRAIRRNGHRTFFFCCPTAACTEGEHTGFYRFRFERGRFLCQPFTYDDRHHTAGGAVSFVPGEQRAYSYTR